MGNSNSELNQTDSLNESGECKNEEWNKKFKEIKTLHDKSYHFIESGITEEELDHKEEVSFITIFSFMTQTNRI